jgi:hypothetical protein
MGKPVISSRLKAIRYYFSDEAFAFFEPNDASDLAKQMLRLYQDSQLRIKFAEKAKQEYEPIRWEVMRQRYLVMMGDLVGSRRDTRPGTGRQDPENRPKQVGQTTSLNQAIFDVSG